MWRPIIEKFKNHPAQEKVLRILFERGFKVDNEKKVKSGKIEIPHTQLAREANVDRRVIDATIDTILKDEMLKEIFQNITSIPFLRDVAPSLELGVIIITPEDAASTGILAEVATVIANHDISIRQAVSDDPYFKDEPKLTIITDSKVPGYLVDEILKLSTVKGVSIY